MRQSVPAMKTGSFESQAHTQAASANRGIYFNIYKCKVSPGGTFSLGNFLFDERENFQV